MHATIKHSPAYAIAYVELDYGETLQVESGAMATMSTGLDVAGSFGSGGMIGAAKRRMLGGETFFVAKYTAQIHGAWLAVAPRYPGDVTTIDLSHGTGVLMEQGAFLAADESINVDVKWAGLRNIALREGATVLHADGQGLLIVSSYGGLDRYDLGEGEQVIVDTGHLVAWEDRVGIRVGPLKSVATSALVGEGLVAVLSGPGTVWVQTRAEQQMRTWLFPGKEQNRFAS